MIHPQILKDPISQFGYYEKNANSGAKILDKDKYPQLFTCLRTHNKSMRVAGTVIYKQIKKTSQSAIWRLE